MEGGPSWTAEGVPAGWNVGVVPMSPLGPCLAWEFVVNHALSGAVAELYPPVPVPPGCSPGLTSCLEEGRLLSGGRPAGASPFDIDALRIVERAVAQRGPVLICPADPFAPLSPLVAAVAHIAAMVQEHRRSGIAAPSPLRIAVISNDYRLRGLYRGLAVAERRGVAGVALKSIVPTATLSSGGQLSVIDSDDGRWSTAFVRSIRQAESLGDLDLLVVDLPVPDSDRLTGLTVPTVVIARDPGDDTVARLAASTPVFGYDGLSVPSWGPPVDEYSRLRLMNRRAQQLKIVRVHAPAVLANAELFRQDSGSLVNLSKRQPYASRLVREAFGLFHDLLGLAMPAETFGRLTGRPLRPRIRALAMASRRMTDVELREEWLPMVEAELSGLLDALDGGQAASAPGDTKTDVLKHVVADALDEHRDVLVVTRTAALARAYAEYLTTIGLSAARVTSVGGLADTRPGDTAVLLGAAPAWASWVYRAGAGRELVVLGYSSSTDGPLDSQADGVQGHDSSFDEARVIIEAIRRQNEAGRRISIPVQRSRSWAAVTSGLDDGRPVADLSIEDAGGSLDLEVTSHSAPGLPSGLWDGADWVSEIGSDAMSERTSTGDIDKVSPGSRVTFADGTWAWLCDETEVWRWRRYTGAPQQVPADRLVVGDDVLLVDDDAHKTLFDKIQEAAENIPALAIASGWLGHWTAMLHNAHTRFGSYRAVAQELGRLGCSVQAQTVRLWCVGATIGPEDPEDVRRLGLLLDDPVLTDHHMKVWQAMRTLRGAHIKLGRRLAGLVRSLGPAVEDGRLRGDEVVDEASGLTAADLESAVVMLKVIKIDRVPEVPHVLAGARRQPTEPVDVITGIRNSQEQAS